MSPANDGYGQGWGEAYSDLVLPSGAKCMIRKLQLEDMAELGIIDHIDMLQDLVQTEHIDRVKKPQDRQQKKPTKAQLAEQEKAEQKKTFEMMKDKAKFGKMVDMIDKIVVACVVKPSLVSAYEGEDEARRRLGPDERKSGLIYSDTISFEDKMDIFNVAFQGVNKLSSFREESSEDVGDMVDESESAVQTV